jgi:outer membrane protein TolC
MKQLLSAISLVLLSAGCMHPVSEFPEPRPLNIHNASTQLSLPEDGSLSLTDSVLIALSRNRDLAVQLWNPERAVAEKDLESAAFGTELFGSTAIGEETSSETARSTGERFAVEAESRESEVGVRRNFSSGTELGVTVSEQDESSNRAPAQQEVRVGLELTQPLLQGASRGVNRIFIRQAELGIRISNEELRAYTQALIAQTEIAYWQLQLAKEAVDITRKAVDISTQHLAEIRDGIEIGQVAPDEALAIQAELSSRKRALVNAEATLNDQQFRLSLLLGSETGDQPNLTPTTALPVPDQPIQDPTPFLTQSSQLNPRLREARLRLQQNTLEVDRTRNGVLPRLDFFARLDKTGFGTDFSSASDDITGDNYEWNLGLQFVQDLGQNRQQAEQKIANINRRQAEQAVINLEHQVANDIQRAVIEYNRTLQQTRLSKETAELKQATADAEQSRFELGTSTSLQVAQAQREALESQLNELESRIQYRIALLRLQELTGELLIRYGVDVGL